MIIRVLLITGSALIAIQYLLYQLILNYTTFIYSIKSRKHLISTNKGLQLEA